MVNLEPCDVLMFKSDGSFIQNAISEVTKSPYVHSAIAVGDGNLIESNGFIKTREFPLSGEAGFDVYRIDKLTNEQKEKIINFAQSKIGTKYDYEKILGLLIRFELLPHFKGFTEPGHFICSGLVDEAFFNAAVSRKNKDFIGNLVPGELLTYYKFKRIVG